MTDYNKPLYDQMTEFNDMSGAPQKLGLFENEETSFTPSNPCKGCGGKGSHSDGKACQSCNGTGNKKAGFNFFFPGQVLREFYPGLQHNLVDYPNDNNTPMQDPAISGGEDIPDEVALEGVNVPDEPLNKITAYYDPSLSIQTPGVSSSPAGGIGIGRDGKPQVLDGAPLRQEDDIRGPQFTEEFYQNNTTVPGKYLASKQAAGDAKGQLADFLKGVCGEIAKGFLMGFELTKRGIKMNGMPSEGSVNLVEKDSRIMDLLEHVNDGDLREALNQATAQAAVWSKGLGGFAYEVYVRGESIDTDTGVLKYKFVTGTKG